MEFDVVSLISQVGFPIAVAAYSLIVLNKTLGGVRTALQENTRVISVLCAKFGVVSDMPGIKELE